MLCRVQQAVGGSNVRPPLFGRGPGRTNVTRHGSRGDPMPPCATFRLVVVSLRAWDSPPFFPSHVLGCCFLSATAAGALAGVVSAFAEPSSWCVGAVLDVAWCAISVSLAPSSWRIQVVLVVAGVV